MMVVLKFAESTSILGWSPDIVCSTMSRPSYYVILAIPQQEFCALRRRRN
jgi:hypothetical protein